MPRLAWAVVVAASLPCPAASAGEIRFRRHDLDLANENPAAAAFDVNGDGALDLAAGGWWYEAPAFERRFLREVEQIRGRNDDYSNLPLDVNGDGRLDLVSANYRSRSLYWVEHPGAALGDDPAAPWTRHVIEEPGPSETGRLYDVDADGRLDLVPTGMEFAAWWELRPADAGGPPAWVRHELPAELAGHALGFGDVNGDGRGDFVALGGWAEAPEDRRSGRWVFHPDWRLHPDASTPVLVHDVDADGDADLVWGRGHRTGLYWLEQAPRSTGEGQEPVGDWTLHTIDTSWSQAHALLLADLDGDGGVELIAGKRWMGHEGKDPGEYDPSVIYAYRFQPASGAWRRLTISPPGDAGFDLDPKAADLDGDGDVDLLAPSRNGLRWFENLGADAPEEPPSPALLFPAPPQQPLVIRGADGELGPVDSPAAWARRRVEILAGMETVMGPLPGPEARVPLAVDWGEPVEHEKYLRRRITYAADPDDRVPAQLLIPKGLTRPAPAMLCLHSTQEHGKNEVAGLAGRPSRMYGHELAERGFVCLIPDYPSFGEYPCDFAAHRERYPSGTMKAIWNNLRGIDLLESLPEVDRDRIGAIGHSLGGHNALFTAAFDPRIQAVAVSCSFTAFHHYYEGNLAGWTSDRYMPRIRDVYENDPDQMPFDFHGVLGVIAPRPIWINAPLRDDNFAVAGVREVVAAVDPVYELLGRNAGVTAVYPDCEHDFPDAQREEAYQWLAKELMRTE